jgi:hypothetical protein
LRKAISLPTFDYGPDQSENCSQSILENSEPEVRKILMIRHVPLIVAFILVLATTGVLAQEGSAVSTPDVAYWVDYWSRPPVNLFDPGQEEFNKNMQPIFFPWNDHDDPSNPSVLDSDAQWLKDYPNMRFYVDG